MSQGREWDGKDRRSAAPGTQELSAQVSALSAQVEEVAKTVAAMQRCFDMFRTKYEQHLKDQLEAQQWWATLRNDLSTSLIKSVITAVLIGIAVLIAFGARQRLIEWLQ